MSLSIKIKTSPGGVVYDIEVPEYEYADVSTLKQLVEQKTEIPSADQRLIYKGRVLSAEKTLTSYGIQEGHTILLVKGRPSGPSSSSKTSADSQNVESSSSTTSSTPNVSNTSSAAPNSSGSLPTSSVPNPFANLSSILPSLAGNNATGGTGGANPFGLPMDMESMSQLLNNPAMETIMNDFQERILQNPDILADMAQSNPNLRNIMEQRPEISRMLRDPEIFRQSLNAMRNPNLMRQMMREQDQAFNHIQSLPGGYQAYQEAFNEFGGPLQDQIQASLSGQSNQNQQDSAPQMAEKGDEPSATNPWGDNLPSNNNTSAASNSANNPFASMFNAFSNNNASNNQTSTGTTGSTASSSSGADPNPFANMMAGLNQNTGANNANPFGMDMNQMMSLLQNPVIQNMVQNMLSNPQSVQSLLNDPLFASSLNPNRAGAGPSTSASATPNNEFLSSMFANMNAFNPGAATQSQSSASSTSPASTGNNISNQATPNPFSLLRTGLPTSSTVDPRVRFSSQIALLADMGFTNNEAVVQALISTNGNLEAAIDLLTGN